MRLRVPTSLNGWRTFLGEVGIIVVGVLLALGAEQLVQSLRWSEEVAMGREVIKDDLIANAEQALEREALSRCLGKRFQEIAQILDEASVSGRLPPVGEIGNPPKRLWHMQSWDSMVASQVSTHFPKSDILALGNLTAFMRAVEDINIDEFSHWTTLWTIVGPGRQMAAGDEPQLRQALVRAAYDAKLMRISTNQLLDQIRASQLLSPEEFANLSKTLETDLKQRLPSSPLCQPLGTAPAHYGGSPLKMDLLTPYSD